MSELRRHIMMQQGEHNLPSGYSYVEWLQTNGDQYIDTGILSTSDLDYDITAILAVYNSQNQRYFGYYENNIGIGAYYQGVSPDAGGLLINIGFVTVDAHVTWEGKKMRFVKNDNIISAYENNLLLNSYVQNTPFSYDHTILYGAFNNGVRVYPSENVRLLPASFYLNGRQIANIKPCKNDITGEGLFFDTIRNIFLSNIGSGSFIVGNPV